MNNQIEFENDDIVYAGVTMTLSREDALAIIRSLATYGDTDTTLTIRVINGYDGKRADFSVGGGMGPVLSVEHTLVRVPKMVMA